MKPKILLLDIETSPMLSYVWALFSEQGGLPMLKKDWNILSWAAKWYGEDKIMQMDQRKAKNIEDEKAILKGMWKLLDEADIVITHNGDKFDLKKLNTRFVKFDLGKPSPYRSIDTLKIARKHFSFTSNKLEYLAEFLKCKFKKMKSKKFPGVTMWDQCLARNPEAWKEMEAYNKQDVLTLEAVYDKLKPWDKTINFSIFNAGNHICSCGSTELIKKGTTDYSYTNHGYYQRYRCKSCGAPYTDKTNLLTPEQRKNMKK